MKPFITAGLVAVFATALLHAGPTESAIVAAMKLSDAPNYTWSTSVVDDARTYTVDGKTDKTDFSNVTMPMVSALRRRTVRGSASSDNTVTAIFRGDEKLVIETPEGWKKPDELNSGNSRGGYSGRPGGPGGAGGGYPGGMRRGRPGGSSDRSRGGEPPAYSNLQVNLSRPHEELGIIVANATDMKVDGEIVSGSLAEMGAKLLLVHPGQNEITPLSASGTFRLWVRDGAVVKYEVKLEGTLDVETPNDRRKVQVHQTATTTLSNIGSTVVDVPPEARKKLGA